MRPAPPLLDGLAISASFLCLVHCLALPLVIAALPALASLFDVPESFHVWMLAIAVPLSGLAIGLGWRRHGRIVPVILALAGLALMSWGALGGVAPGVETALTTLGGLCLAGGHIRNWRLGAAHRHCADEA